MATSPFLGYTSTETREGLSWALEGYLNDYGIARMGQALYQETGQRRYKEESDYFLNRAQDYVQLFDDQGRLLPGPERAGRLAGGVVGVRPARLGPRLHGDQRLGLRLHRPAGQPGPGQPVRRPRRVWRTSSTTTSRPRRRPSPEFVGSYGGGHPRDDGGAGRPDGHVRPLQPGGPPRELHVRRGRPALEDAEERPRGPVPALHGQRDRPGLPRRRGQRRAVGLVPVLGARLLPVGHGQRRVRRSAPRCSPRRPSIWRTAGTW